MANESENHELKNIIRPAMRDLGERLARLYIDIVDAVELPEYSRNKLILKAVFGHGKKRLWGAFPFAKSKKQTKSERTRIAQGGARTRE